jgi:hypothetical protein
MLTAFLLVAAFPPIAKLRIAASQAAILNIKIE